MAQKTCFLRVWSNRLAVKSECFFISRPKVNGSLKLPFIILIFVAEFFYLYFRKKMMKLFFFIKNFSVDKSVADFTVTAMKDLEAKTCLRFVPRRTQETDYLYIAGGAT